MTWGCTSGLTDTMNTLAVRSALLLLWLALATTAPSNAQTLQRWVGTLTPDGNMRSTRLKAKVLGSTTGAPHPDVAAMGGVARCRNGPSLCRRKGKAGMSGRYVRDDSGGVRFEGRVSFRRNRGTCSVLADYQAGVSGPESSPAAAPRGALLEGRYVCEFPSRRGVRFESGRLRLHQKRSVPR